MKNLTRALVLSLSLLAVACGDSKEDDKDGEGGGGGGGGGNALQCSAVGWCTTWSADTNEVTNAPPLTGGTLREGTYRVEQGIGYDAAMVLRGNSVILLGGSWNNYLGTWKVSNGKLELTRASSCDDYSEGPLDNLVTEVHSFAVRGDELFTQDQDDSRGTILRWKRVNDLCEESASFKCRGSVCSCATTTNKPMTGQQSCAG
ncbi:hypothetical protein [Myxococcus xanthus]|uniref:Lipoprotein n=1 Tax=Myxococcus xanthus TaxID=34 RepID=A0A7Y4MQK4_MYXXA|nr:hypothetical protein [Myxococcus xanthus]NOJ77533.1 hypothetical protein [Myxococcus xanthus]NOJ84755.1 hypothetical protein [Myxococcus xanthus]